MTDLLIRIILIFLRVIYAVMKLRPARRNEVLFISRQSDKPSADFYALISGLRLYGGIRITALTRRQEKDSRSFMRNAPSNFAMILRQMNALSRARVAITDGYSIPVSCLKHRKELTVIQIWHAIGAIKKFGLQTNNVISAKKQKRNKLLHMHEGYDCVIAPSKQTAAFYSESFGVSPDKIFITGTPHLDMLYECSRASNEKKTVVYLPTYRDHPLADTEDTLRMAFDKEKYNFISKVHPINFADSEFENDKLAAEELIAKADAVITDYSSVAFDAALLGIPLFFYVYDTDSYSLDPGLNINPETEYEKYSSRNSTELASLIDKALSDNNCGYDFNFETDFANRYIETFDGQCTERLLTLITAHLERNCNA